MALPYIVQPQITVITVGSGPDTVTRLVGSPVVPCRCLFDVRRPRVSFPVISKGSGKVVVKLKDPDVDNI